MATKIRLQRHGRKRAAIFHIVAADSRAKRDGKFIERIGLYNPNTNPATVELNFEAALKWVKSGAELTDTARTLLSAQGVLLKKHLDGGVVKGALTQEQADAKFAAWLNEKAGLVDATKKSLADAKAAAKKEALAAEVKKNEERAAAIAAANAAALEVEEAPAAEEAPEAAEESAE